VNSEIWTIKRTLDWTKDYFQKHDIQGARFDAEILISHTLQIPRIKLYVDFERPLTKNELSTLKDLIKRRCNREPIAYILGQKDFYSETFTVNSDVLIPRPETELIIDEIKKIHKQDDVFSFLDIGTGSGCLAVIIKKLFPHSVVTATDISDKALAVARENSKKILASEDAILFLNSDVFNSVPGSFDIIASNPPYIPYSTKPSLDPDVRDYEPALALFADNNGMAIYEKIVSDLSKHLNPSGILFLESGVEVIEPLKKLILESGYDYKVSKDLQEIERILIIPRKE